MKIKTLENPTIFFFKQAQNYPDQYREQIDILKSKLINTKQCIMCKQQFVFDNNLPRILIHCGHTICTKCLYNFFMYFDITRKDRVRCPLCLKLVKHIDSIQQLPINHTIFYILVKQYNEKNNDKIEPDVFLYNAFDMSSKIRIQRENGGQKIDPQTHLPVCLNHENRIQHFYCKFHKVFQSQQAIVCRICAQSAHTKANCVIQDLYEVQDLDLYLSISQKNNVYKKGLNEDNVPIEYEDFLKNQGNYENLEQMLNRNRNQNQYESEQDGESNNSYE